MWLGEFLGLRAIENFVADLIALGMLLAMFITWEVEGHPHYPSMSADQHIA